MRNQAFAIPIEFTWKVARGGYCWIVESGKRYLCAVDALEKPDWPDPFDRYEQMYRPLEERTGLFREFAELKPTEAQILAFANRYGQLGQVTDLKHDSRFGPIRVRGEMLEDWKREIRTIKSTVTLWDAINDGNKNELARFKSLFDLPQLPFAVRRRLYLDKADPLMAALGAIQRDADARLGEHVAARLVFSGDSPRLRICLLPQNLLGALWLQFAASVDALKNFLKCVQCGASFEISRDPSTGKRTDARFCRARCRVNHYRDRIERARRLRAAGRSEAEIARELKSQLSTVRGWLVEGAGGRGHGRRS